MPIEIDETNHALGEFLSPTPLRHCAELSKLSGAHVWFKLENRQPTGSFKVRGAFAKMLACEETHHSAGPPRGYVAASTGNHGAAVAHAAKELNRSALIFVPEGAAGTKLAMIAGRSARIVKHGQDCLEAETEARRYAQENNLVYISPYNDPDVVAGQGTIVDELIEQFESEALDVVIASVGGGGLIGGIASRLHDFHPNARAIGVSPENSCVLIDSLAAGRVVPDSGLPTLSDGTAGGIEENAVTLEICRRHVDHFTTVTEDDIARTLRWFQTAYDDRIEGAAAVAIAGFLKLKNNFAGQNVVIVLCGGNIDEETLARLAAPVDQASA